MARSRMRFAAALALVMAPMALMPVTSSAALTPRAAIASALNAGDHSESLTWGGLVRTYVVHVPPGPAATRRPLILVYHGANDTALNTITETDFEQVADHTGDVVVFLQGYRDTWNEETGHTPAAQAHVDDVGFTRAVLRALTSLVAYDPRRVAATGISNGALMVETLGCRLAGQLRLIVPVEGELARAVSPSCAPSRPLNVYEIHGTADPSIPYSGGVFQGVGGSVSVLSAHASVARWARLDGCRHGPVAHAAAGVTLSVYSSCRSGVNVTLRTIIGGVHAWGANIGELVSSALGH
jgi:polyhydroxybutyrate depolymerase